MLEVRLYLQSTEESRRPSRPNSIGRRATSRWRGGRIRAARGPRLSKRRHHSDSKHFQDNTRYQPNLQVMPIPRPAFKVSHAAPQARGTPRARLALFGQSHALLHRLRCLIHALRSHRELNHSHPGQVDLARAPATQAGDPSEGDPIRLSAASSTKYRGTDSRLVETQPPFPRTSESDING